METMSFVIMAAIAAGVMIVVLFLIFSTEKDVRRNTNPRPRRPPAKAQADVCGICFGTIMNNDVIAKCECSQTFHEACARPTGKCPYCDRQFSDFKIESPECAVCPSCGADVVGSVCGCGAVINREGFVCSCGSELNVNDPVCKKCGKRYEVRSGRKV